MDKVFYDIDSDCLNYESGRKKKTTYSDFPMDFYLDSKGITGFKIHGFTGKVEIPMETQLKMKGDLSYNRDMDILTYGVDGALIETLIKQDNMVFTLDKKRNVIGMVILGLSGLCRTVRFIPFFGVR